MATQIQPQLRVGDRAPDFTLPSTRGGRVTLSSFAGKNDVLLAFFPQAFTRVCTDEMCSFWSENSRFAQAGARVLGISVDHTPSQKAFQEQAGFQTELLSDFRHEVARAYGVMLEEEGYSKRAYFLVDRQGIVRWIHIEKSLADRRPNDDLLSAIRAL